MPSLLGEAIIPRVMLPRLMSLMLPLLCAAATAQAQPRTGEAKAACEALVAARDVPPFLAQVVAGQTDAFQQFAGAVDAVHQGMDRLSAVPEPQQTASARLKRAADYLVARQQVVVPARAALNALRSQPLDLVAAIDKLAIEEQAGRSPATRVSAVYELKAIAQRLSMSATALSMPGGLRPENVFQLKKDAVNFRDLAAGLIEGDANLRLPRVRSAAARKLLEEIMEGFEPTRKSSETVFASLRELAGVQAAEVDLLATLKIVEAALRPLCLD